MITPEDKGASFTISYWLLRLRCCTDESEVFLTLYHFICLSRTVPALHILIYYKYKFYLGSVWFYEKKSGSKKNYEIDK
jgi:hypothetical protein